MARPKQPKQEKRPKKGKKQSKKGGNHPIGYDDEAWSSDPRLPSSESAGGIAGHKNPVNGIDEQLRKAVQSHSPNINEVQRFIDAGANVNAVDENGRSVLHEAVYHGNERLVQLLLEHHANVNAKDSTGMTPLYEITDIDPKSQAAPMARLLHSFGADISAKDEDGFTPLFQVAEAGRPDLVPVLAQLGADLNARDGENWPLLTYAASRGHTGVVEELLKLQVSPKVRGGRYGNALQAAAAKGRNKTVQLLLQWGVDPNMPGGEFRYALQAAAFKGKERVVRILVAAGARIEGDEETPYEDAIIAARAGQHASNARVARWLEEWKAGTATMEFQSESFTSWDKRRGRQMTVTRRAATYDSEDGGSTDED